MLDYIALFYNSRTASIEVHRVEGRKIYDFQKVTFSTLFKLYIAGLGVLIPKRYHMWG